MADDLRLNVVTTADSKGLDKAAKDIKDTKAEADKLGKAFDSAGDNAESMSQDVDGATKSIKDHGEQVRRLREEYEKTTKRIGELDAQFVAGGDRGAIKKDLREQRTLLADIRRAARELKVDLGGDAPTSGIMQDLLGGIPKIGGASPALIAGGVAIGAVLAPPIAAAISGAVLGTVGAGGVVGGALLASRDAQVRGAFRDLGDFVMEELTPAGDDFKAPLLRALAELKADIGGANLGGVIGSASPLLEPFTRGVSGFATELTESLGRAFGRAGPLFAVWQKEFPEFGDAVGDALDSISAASGPAAKGLQDFFNVMEIGTRSVGDATGGLVALNALMGGVGGPLLQGLDDTTVASILLFGALGGVGGALREASPEVQKAGQMMAGFADSTHEGKLALMEESIAIQDVTRKTQDLAIAQLDATVKARDLKASWDELHGATMTLDEAYKRAFDGLENVKQAFEGADDSIKGFSEGAVDRRTALQQEAEKAIAVAQAYLDMTGDAAGAQKKLDDLKNSTINATGATGNAKKAVKELADELFKLPVKREIFVTTYFRNSFEADFRAGERETSGRAPTSGIGTRARGGPVYPNRDYLVGEEGPEILRMGSKGGAVYPNGAMPSGGGWGNARPLVIAPTGNPFADGAFEWLRTEISARGGTLAVLGLRAA